MFVKEYSEAVGAVLQQIFSNEAQNIEKAGELVAESLQKNGLLYVFGCGHSHILKIMYDEALQCLHINPGAAGNQGWHKVSTLTRFTIDEENIKNCEVIELGLRGRQVEGRL